MPDLPGADAAPGDTIAVTGPIERGEVRADGIVAIFGEAQMMFNMPTMYAAIFAAGALGYGLTLLLLGLESRFVHWSGRS